MLNTNIDWYEKLTAKQVWDEIDPNYNIEEDSTVFRAVHSTCTVTISQPAGTDEWCCEIEGESIDAQGFGNNAGEALASAIVDAVGYDVLREEDNCEDAVNGIAREAYVLSEGECPIMEMDASIVDWYKGAARSFVRDNGGSYGIAWEEF